MKLSKRRVQIAEGLTDHTEDQRIKYLSDWKKSGFDVTKWIDPLKVVPPSIPVKVDVIVPFWENDFELIPSTLESLLRQLHVNLTIHIISDGCGWPKLPSGSYIKYETSGGWGPYRITNAVFPNLKSDYLALNDGDDISYPDRLWKQVQRLRVTNSDITCCSMVNTAVGEVREDNGMSYWVGKSIPSRRVFETHGPWGVLINGSRMMKRSLFERVNGFKNEKCGMDFQFDNRIQRLSIPTFFDDEVMMDRRMHADSLSLGEIFGVGNPARDKTNDIVRNDAKELSSNPVSLKLVRSQGDLDTTERIYPKEVCDG